MDLNFNGLIMGGAVFLIIGLFHPIVIKTEYYFGTRPWIVFLALGIAGGVLSVFMEDSHWSTITGIISFCCLWSIKELFEQKERVRKGWFPKNPKRGKGEQ